LLADYNNYFLARAQLLISRKAVSLYTSFSTHKAVCKTKNSLKSIPTINPAITENTECSIVKARTLFIDLKVGASFNHGASLCFAFSFSNVSGNVPSKE